MRTHIVAIEDVLESVQSGVACGERDASESGIRQLRMNSFGEDGQLDLDGSVRVPADQIKPRYLLQNGDVVVNNTNSFELVGRAAVVEGITDQPVSFSNHITRLRLKSGLCRSSFLASWIQHQWMEGRLNRIITRFVGQSCISLESFLQLTISLPQLPTQDQINKMIRACDAARVGASEISAQTSRTKSALMQQLLLPNSKTRKNFKARHLGELFAERKESGKPGLPTLSVTMNDGMVDRDELGRRVESELTPEQHLLARKHDIAYNMMRMWQGVSGLAPYDGLVSPAYVVLKPLAGIDPLFASYLFNLPETIRLFHRYSQGLTNDRLRLYYDQFAEIRIPIPTEVAEQKRIARLLSAFDHHIEQSETL
ncbi:MAG: restriction endonuclease subunit S, partial [Verrucomicrobiae bacterium]|nr:restriction endonuclease subunit S [Verrucomicrobiae bacterium]